MERRPQEPHDQGAGHARRPRRPWKNSCAAGVTLNVTLIFSERQYHAARDAMWRGAQAAQSLDDFKSVYSIFVSRLDVYTEQHVPQLSPAAQGMVGIVNAKRIWQMNQQFWADKKLPLKQEMIFASTGTKKPEDPPWKYVEAFAGSDIETNPPATNDAVQKSGRTFTRQVDEMPPPEVLDEIDDKVDMKKLEETLMEEGHQEVRRPAEGAAEVDRDQASRVWRRRNETTRSLKGKPSVAFRCAAERHGGRCKDTCFTTAAIRDRDLPARSA